MNSSKFILFTSLFFLLFLTRLSAQVDTDSVSAAHLIIGLKEAPPFIIKKGDGYDGISVRLWRQLAEELGITYEFAEYPLPDLLQAIEQKKVDLCISPLTVTAERIKRIDFSQPYFISSVGVVAKKQSLIKRLLGNLFSLNFLKAISALLALILLFGALVWFFEKGRNHEEFPKGVRGLGEAFWWSAVTMTTVGYGDKSPQTFGGRLISFIWMFTAIVLISSLTASIASSLTVGSLDTSVDNIDGLNGFKVGTVAKSSTQSLLEDYGLAFQSFDRLEDGLKAIQSEKIDFFIYDRPILNYYINKFGIATEVNMLPISLSTDYYSYSFPKGSDLIPKVNPKLVGHIKSNDWRAVLNRYNVD